MPTVMTRIEPHDLERLTWRAKEDGFTSAQEITMLLDFAEFMEKFDRDPALEAYRARFTRAPKPDEVKS